MLKNIVFSGLSAKHFEASGVRKKKLGSNI